MGEPRTSGSDRQVLMDAVTLYFKAVDGKDVPGALALFNEDAELIVQTDHKRFEGHSAIGGMFTEFFANSLNIEHEILNWVVEPSSGKCATEQIYRGTLK